MVKKIASAAAGLAMLAAGAAPALAETSYGSIATSAGYYGISTDHDSREVAERAAVKHCQGAVHDDHAHETCVARMWFTKCGAVVQSEHFFAWGSGNSEGEAVHDAKVKMHGHGEVMTKGCNGE